MLAAISAGMGNINTKSYDAYAHNFSPDSISTFLTLSLRADIELSLASRSFPSNVTLALDHAENALNLTNDAYYFDDDILYDSDFMERYDEAQNNPNSTIQALVVANLVDQVLSEYGQAFEVGYDLTNMSNINRVTRAAPGSDMQGSSHSSYSMNMDMNIPSITVAEENYTEIVNVDNYQSAQELAETANQIFKNKLIHSSHNTSTGIIYMIQKNLTDLKDLVDKKLSAEYLMILVHTKLHPNLQNAYDLKLRQ
jgi:hypothetical protein